MKTLHFSIIIGAMIVSIFTISFFIYYYTTNQKAPNALLVPSAIPYATLTISRLDNFIVPSTIYLPFQPLSINMLLPQDTVGGALIKEAIVDVNSLYNETSKRCNQGDSVNDSYCEPQIYAVYSINMTKEEFNSLASVISLQFLNSTKTWSAYLYYKDSQCHSLAHGLATRIQNDEGFCYYDVMVVKNHLTGEK